MISKPFRVFLLEINNPNPTLKMSDDDNQLLDAVLALVKGQQLQTIEEKRQTSLLTRMLKHLESIDKSLEQGQLAEQLRYFLGQLKPELREPHALHKAKAEKKSLQGDIRRALGKARSYADSNGSSDNRAVASIH